MSVILVEVGHVRKEDMVSLIPRGEVVGDGDVIRGGQLGDAVDPITSSNQVGSPLIVGSPLVVGHVQVGPVMMEAGSKSGPFGPNAHLWNPFIDVEAHDNRALTNNPISCGRVGLEGVCLEEERFLEVADVVIEGANNFVRSSQISESSLESTQGEGGQTKKAMKKGISNPVRPPPPLIGVPTFRKLELSLKAAAGRKRKEGSKQTQGGDDSVGNGTQLVPEPPAKIHGDFELHVAKFWFESNFCD
jgi:hypothetical protein